MNWATWVLVMQPLTCYVPGPGLLSYERFLLPFIAVISDTRNRGSLRNTETSWDNSHLVTRQQEPCVFYLHVSFPSPMCCRRWILRVKLEVCERAHSAAGLKKRSGGMIIPVQQICFPSDLLLWMSKKTPSIGIKLCARANTYCNRNPLWSLHHTPYCVWSSEFKIK